MTGSVRLVVSAGCYRSAAPGKRNAAILKVTLRLFLLIILLFVLSRTAFPNKSITFDKCLSFW